MSSDIVVGTKVIITAKRGVQGTENTNDFAHGVAAHVIAITPCNENGVWINHIRLENQSGKCWAEISEFEKVEI